MKNKKLIIIEIIAMLIMICVPNISKAGYESRIDGNMWKSISISGAYETCRDLSNPTSTLGVATVDPHLILNKDWGAVAYLALSPFGEVDAGTTQKTVYLKGKNNIGAATAYLTVTGNASGIMNFGKHSEWTSSLRSSASNTENPDWRKNLTDNLGTKYVEDIASDVMVNNESSKGMALSELKGFGYSMSMTASLSCFFRNDVRSLFNQFGSGQRKWRE